MNLNKGIFRIWLIIVPIVWIVLFVYTNDNIPFYSCETSKESNCQCVKTLGNEKRTYNRSCFEQIFIECGGLNNKALGFKNTESCEAVHGKWNDAEKETICSLDKEKIKSCELQRNKDQVEFFIFLIPIIILPLTFYPIYLGLRRLFMWVREGFKK